jgi:hypothetical protein
MPRSKHSKASATGVARSAKGQARAASVGNRSVARTTTRGATPRVKRIKATSTRMPVRKPKMRRTTY